MTTLNTSQQLNRVDVGTAEPKDRFWDRFLDRLDLVFSGAAGLSPEQIEELDAKDLANLANPWMM